MHDPVHELVSIPVYFYKIPPILLTSAVIQNHVMEIKIHSSSQQDINSGTFFTFY